MHGICRIQWVCLIFVLGNCAKPQIPFSSYDPYSLDTLSFLDEIMVELSEGDSKVALDKLRSACQSRDTTDGFLCYTQAMVEYKNGNYKESYLAVSKALQKNPKDSLYLNLARLSGSRQSEIQNWESVLPEQETQKEFTLLLQDCHLDSAIRLGEKGLITPEMTKKGRVSLCFANWTADEKKLISLTKSKMNYSEAKLEDKVSRDSFHEIWDTEPYHKGLGHAEVDHYKSPIAEAWRKFRLASISGRSEEARRHLLEFKTELNKWKKNSKSNKAGFLEKAAKLLIEQDQRYSEVRHLAKELSYTP